MVLGEVLQKCIVVSHEPTRSRVQHRPERKLPRAHISSRWSTTTYRYLNLNIRQIGPITFVVTTGAALILTSGAVITALGSWYIYLVYA